jgi:hypothetical protein
MWSLVIHQYNVAKTDSMKHVQTLSHKHAQQLSSRNNLHHAHIILALEERCHINVWSANVIRMVNE